MFADSFEQIEHGEAAKILDRLNPQLDGSPFDPAMARILSHSLPFYTNCSLIEVTDHDVNPPRKISMVRENNEGTIHILNGTNEPIYNLNQTIPFSLNAETVKLYTRFFFSYVRGRHGHFFVTENADEINWREEPAPNARKALGKMISPLSIESTDEAGTFHLKASIIFKDSLFESDVQVTKDGVVSLSNQELLVEDIPVIDDSFAQ